MTRSFFTSLPGRVLSATLAVSLAGTCAAQQQPDDFFDTIAVDLAPAGSDRPFSVLGWVTQKAAWGLEAPGAPFSRQQRELNKFETSVFGQFDARLSENSSFRFSGKLYHDEIYRIKDDTAFSAGERSEFRNRFEIRDFYIEQRFNNGLYLKLGNQILAWGLSEYLRVTDLVNVEDQYTIGQQDLEDLRLQVPAALAGFNLGSWLLEGAVTYRAGRDDIAPLADEFDPFIPQRRLGARLQRRDPDSRTEYFLRASTRLPRGDLQLVAGEFNDNGLTVDRIEDAATASPLLTYSQNRMRAVGVAANWVEGSWLFFGELGLHQDKAMRPARQEFLQTSAGWREKDQVLSVAGIEYNGLRNLMLAFEVNNVHTRGHDALMEADRDQVSFGLRGYWTAFNERLQVLGVWNELADDNGRIARLSLEYNYSDQLDLGLMWVKYDSPSSSIYYDYRNNDTLQLQLRYNFQW